MPRQTFATREFFVNACETATRQSLDALPYTFSKIRFIAENPKLHCFHFLYDAEGRQSAIQVTISLLPLNEGCTKVTVHGSYPTGNAFTNDPCMTLAMLNVEGALQATISGAARFEPLVPKKKLVQRCQHVTHNTTVFISNAFKVRRLVRPSHS
jgi:hypothetical protein